MTVVLPQVLQPNMILERISRINLHNDGLQKNFGFQSGGNNIRRHPGRQASIDVVSSSREVGTGRIPGTSAATIAPNPIGNFGITIPRLFESMPLPLERLGNLRALGGPASSNDPTALSYINAQEVYLKDRVVSFREFQTAAMLRGSYTFTPSGDSLLHAFSGGKYTVNFQIPANNLNQLNGIIGTTWSNAAAPIVSNCYAVNAAMEQSCGRNLRHIWVSSVVWGYVLTNTQVQAEAGTANTPFLNIDMDGESGFVAQLRALPGITWHITDRGVNLGGVNGTAGTFTKLIADTQATFLPEWDPMLGSYLEGGEDVVEWVGKTPHMEIGDYYYAAPSANPAGYTLFALANGIPELKTPAAIFNGTVVF